MFHIHGIEKVFTSKHQMTSHFQTKPIQMTHKAILQRLTSIYSDAIKHNCGEDAVPIERLADIASSINLLMHDVADAINPHRHDIDTPCEPPKEKHNF